MIICIKICREYNCTVYREESHFLRKCYGDNESQKYKKQSIRRFYDKRMTLKCFFFGSLQSGFNILEKHCRSYSRYRKPES